MMRATPLQSFWKRIEKQPEGCWRWTGYVLSNGYGQIATRSRPTQSGTRLAHRVSYELANGSIDDELVLDHLCRNRWCVNPSHLEAVTCQENVARWLHGELRTECIYGHPLAGGSGTTGCHGYLTEHPAEAYAGGWSVKRISVDDPEEVPIHVQGGLLWLTDEAGAWTLPRKEQP